MRPPPPRRSARRYREVDLGEARAASPIQTRRPGRGSASTGSHYETPVVHHTGGRHAYRCAPGTVLDADVVINLPKLKTHKKTAVTLSLKSVIGLTNEKYWLPHFTAGDPSVGGDEYAAPRVARRRDREQAEPAPAAPATRSLADRPRPPRGRASEGDRRELGEGNRTLWRTILDLNRILFFADRDGRLRDTPQRRYLTVVDGIVAGEGEGPLGATPVAAGLLVGGFDPALVDVSAARAMGFDPLKIAMIREALGGKLLPGSDLAAMEEAWEGSGGDAALQGRRGAGRASRSDRPRRTQTWRPQPQGRQGEEEEKESGSAASVPSQFQRSPTLLSFPCARLRPCAVAVSGSGPGAWHPRRGDSNVHARGFHEEADGSSVGARDGGARRRVRVAGGRGGAWRKTTT